MKQILSPTEDFVKSSKTTTTAVASASGSPVSLTVVNNNEFSADDYVIVKREGDDQAHICLIDSVSGNDTIVINSLLHDLAIGDEITKIAFNQRKLYGCATEDGTFVFIETKDIAVDNPQGTYFSYTGDYEWFKATYYNETTSTETDIDDAIAGQADEITRYCSVYDIREESGFLDNNYISDGRINSLRLQAESEVKSSIGAVYALPLSSVPEIIKTITKLLAAGWLMWQEYGEEASGTSKDGIAKVEQARSMLKAIRENRSKLFDNNDTELTRASNSVSGGTLSGYPNDDTDDDEDAQFTIDREF